MKLNFKNTGSGPDLIIIHGLMGMLDNWFGPAKVYGESFNVWLLDARNHGKSPHSDVFNYEVMADDVVEFMNDHGIERAHILGHSMGGKIAMKVAQNYPDLLDRLIVADIAPREYPVHHDTILNGLEAVDFSKVNSRGAVDKVLLEYIPEESVRQFLLKSVYWKEKGVLDYRFNLQAIREHIELIGAAIDDDVFEKETLFIRGGASDYVTDEDLFDIHRLFPNSKVDTIEAAGHWLHASHPKEFLEKTVSFLKQS